MKKKESKLERAAAKWASDGSLVNYNRKQGFIAGARYGSRTELKRIIDATERYDGFCTACENALRIAIAAIRKASK